MMETIIAIIGLLFGSGIVVSLIKAVYNSMLYKRRLAAGSVSEEEEKQHTLENKVKSEIGTWIFIAATTAVIGFVIVYLSIPHIAEIYGDAKMMEAALPIEGYKLAADYDEDGAVYVGSMYQQKGIHIPFKFKDPVDISTYTSDFQLSFDNVNYYLPYVLVEYDGKSGFIYLPIVSDTNSGNSYPLQFQIGFDGKTYMYKGTFVEKK